MIGNPLANAMHQLELGEELLNAGVDELFRRWQASATAIGKLCAGTERWQAVFRQMQAPLLWRRAPVPSRCQPRPAHMNFGCLRTTQPICWQSPV